MGLSTEQLNQLPGGYFCFSDEGTIVQINQSLLEQLGYEASDVLGQSIERLLPIASRIFYQTHFYPLLKLQGKAEEIFLSLRMKTGEALPVLLNAATIRQDDRLLHQCVCLTVRQRQKYEDQILEAKRMAEQALRENIALINAKQDLEHHQLLLDQQLAELQQKNQEFWQFGRLITHDLQEPLRKITLLADALQQEANGSLAVDSGRLLDRIVEASQRMRELIRRMRDYMLLEVTQHPIHLVNLDSLAINAQELVSQQLATTDIQLVTQGLPSIDGDRGQLLELFFQLIDNSVRFRHQPILGPVEITITGQLVESNRFRATPGKYSYQPFIQITYTDNGPGLLPELVDKVFQIHKKPGTGLLGFGLAICKKIVDNHRGTISINPTSQPGTQFIILFPVQRTSVINSE
ncbi:PAS domain S-box protein [Spirosoma sp. BT702]|uniref:histidine kinase n=1 Tax=Spirosoma profusum TaxID=2771354 RepID=A0A927G9P8_9BACT|nr:ATP-binding protein [Spirosoma profusum]MBD2704841.1 PAS domain S-box protein [Spirosoma profusum]